MEVGWDRDVDGSGTDGARGSGRAKRVQSRSQVGPVSDRGRFGAVVSERRRPRMEESRMARDQRRVKGGLDQLVGR